MYLLDTDTLIYALKGMDPVVGNFKRHREHPMAMSVITYGELIFGAEKSEHRARNLAQVYRTAEIYPIIDVTRDIMDGFARLKADRRRSGQTMDDFDLLIAATALARGYTLVTNNTRHFAGLPGLRVENWAGPAPK